jgi:hypothetical protein
LEVVLRNGYKKRGIWADRDTLVHAKATGVWRTIQKKLAGFGVGGDTLEQGQGIADPIGDMGGKVRRGQQWVDRYYFLEKRRHNT